MELSIIQSIHEIRGMRVMLDFALAEIYQVETKNLKRSVKHNIERFPDDFMFELTQDEVDSLRCKNCTLKTGSRGEHSKYLPFAFTEQGVAMLSGVLRSQKAIQENIKIMRAFVALRQYALNYANIKHELDDFIRETNAKFDKNDMKFDALFRLLDEFIKHKQELEKPRNPIGFRMDANA
ncbi:MAG: ORF6N domain-containing protein [Lentimicrobiaceae bacterium]|nr:ORF6N domain-containing protein [Lentimicrobiaceae bacterium]